MRGVALAALAVAAWSACLTDQAFAADAAGAVMGADLALAFGAHLGCFNLVVCIAEVAFHLLFHSFSVLT